MGGDGQTKKIYRKGRVYIVYLKALTLNSIYLMQKQGSKSGSLAPDILYYSIVYLNADRNYYRRKVKMMMYKRGSQGWSS